MRGAAQGCHLRFALGATPDPPLPPSQVFYVGPQVEVGGQTPYRIKPRDAKDAKPPFDEFSDGAWVRPALPNSASLVMPAPPPPQRIKNEVGPWVRVDVNMRATPSSDPLPGQSQGLVGSKCHPIVPTGG